MLLVRLAHRLPINRVVSGKQFAIIISGKTNNVLIVNERDALDVNFSKNEIHFKYVNCMENIFTEGFSLSARMGLSSRFYNYM